MAMPRSNIGTFKDVSEAVQWVCNCLMTELCIDEGCPQYGTEHVCINTDKAEEIGTDFILTLPLDKASVIALINKIMHQDARLYVLERELDILQDQVQSYREET